VTRAEYASTLRREGVYVRGEGHYRAARAALVLSVLVQAGAMGGHAAMWHAYKVLQREIDMEEVEAWWEVRRLVNRARLGGVVAFGSWIALQGALWVGVI